ncbi:MAG: Omp28-related outer membrane protein [Flavobacteriales bacterium]|nr:Omp28-related outer membrane protein [Flavobacteriales bacterium]MDG1781416.1 Omp28-related outer membrane protein [Flavobacteriales bacterium]MDG2245443.1 Omp28-related outer membrane protein [Flavobacteriales bacterium]
MKNILSLVVLTAILFTSCDKIDDPVLDFNIQYRSDLYGEAPTFGAASTTTKNVFLEDFTGHNCGFCPDAAVIADEIFAQYPDRVSLMAIHAGSLAEPDPGDSQFFADWTSDDGDVLWDQLDFQFNPAGRINRVGGPGVFLSPTTWVDETLAEINQTAVVNLQIQANFGVEGNHANVHVNGQFASAYENPTNITVYITESDLFGYQLWYDNDPEYVPNYEFKHVLRGSITGPLGLSFTDEAPAANEEVQIDYSYEWNNAWVAENCYVVAVITDNVTGEVLNVIEAHL